MYVRAIHRLWFGTLLLLAVSVGFVIGTSDYRKLHFDALVIDTHNDVVQRMLNGEDISIRTRYGQSDLPRFHEGGVDVEVFSVWAPPDRNTRPYYAQANEQIDSVESFIRRNREQVAFGRNADDIEKLVKDRKFVVMLGLEGGHQIDDDLAKLKRFYDRGVRYMTLTWNNSTDWATSASDETDPKAELTHKGLTNFGRRVVQRMNELGMIVDVSHVGEQTFWDIIKTSTQPVIASHSCAWALTKNRRNLKDEQLKAIAQSGGVVCITFAPWFIDSTFAGKEKAMRGRNKARIDSFETTLHESESSKEMLIAEFLADEYRSIRPSLSKLIDHFDYVARLIGVDHVGIGSDFDGISIPPLEMDDVSFLPNITRELVKRGYNDADTRKILGGNFLRVLREVGKK